MPRVGEHLSDLAVDATVRATARRLSRSRKTIGKGLRPLKDDFRVRERRKPLTCLTVFVLDTSESMHNLERIRLAKGAALALLKSAQRIKQRVALVSCSGDRAELVLAPTTSLIRARRKLKHVPSGGATPLASGLYLAWELARTEHTRNSSLQTVLVLLSDGEANVPRQKGQPVEQDLIETASLLNQPSIRGIIVDTRMNELSPDLQRLSVATRWPVHTLQTDRGRALVRLVQQRLSHPLQND
jgi:magnesium chelatase subunit D